MSTDTHIPSETQLVRWARNILTIAIVVTLMGGYVWLMIRVIGWLT